MRRRRLSKPEWRGWRTLQFNRISGKFRKRCCKAITQLDLMLAWLTTKRLSKWQTNRWPSISIRTETFTSSRKTSERWVQKTVFKMHWEWTKATSPRWSLTRRTTDSRCWRLQTPRWSLWSFSKTWLIPRRTRASGWTTLSWIYLRKRRCTWDKRLKKGFFCVKKSKRPRLNLKKKRVEGQLSEAVPSGPLSAQS